MEKSEYGPKFSVPYILEVKKNYGMENFLAYYFKIVRLRIAFLLILNFPTYPNSKFHNRLTSYSKKQGY